MKKYTYSYYNILIFLAIFFACITPRYSNLLKIDLGLSVSIYAIITLFVWMLYGSKKLIYDGYQFKFMYIYIIVIVISAIYAPLLNRLIQYFYYVFISLLLLLTLVRKNDLKNKNVITSAISYAFSVHVIWGLIETLTNKYFLEVGTFSLINHGQPVTIFRNPNDYSTFIGVLLPFLVYKIKYTCNRLIKIFFIIIFVIANYLIIFTGSRGIILSIIIGYLIMLLNYLYKKKRLFTLIKFLSPVIFTVVIISIFLNESFIYELLPNFNNMNDMVRLNLILNGLHFLKLTKGVGIGAGAVEYWMDNYKVYYTGTINTMHNWYVEILVSFGILFFLIYLYYHIKNIIIMFKNNKENVSFINFDITILSSFIIFTIACISSSSNVYSEWIWMYFAVINYYTYQIVKIKTKERK